MSACRTSQQGDWSAPGTWVDQWVPGPGDTVTIDHPVRLDTAADIGTSTPGQTCLTVNAALDIADGAGLTLRGGVMQANGVVVTGHGAGRILFDASRAQPPSTNWSWRLATTYTTGNLPVSLVIRGTADRRFRVQSAAGGGSGYFNDINGVAPGGGQIDAEYCDFIRIGDAGHALDYAAFDYRTGTLRFDHCVFWGCGAIGGNIAAGSTVSFTGCVATAPVGAFSQLGFWDTGVATLSDCDLDALGAIGMDTASFRTACTGNTYRAWHFENGAWTGPTPAGPYPATYLSFTGPSSATAGQATAAFAVALAGGTTVPGAVTVTPSDGGAGGTFLPASVRLTTDSPRATFTYTPGGTGPIRIDLANDGTEPGGNGPLLVTDPILLTATLPATSYLATGPDPASGAAGGASGPFTVALPPFRTTSVVVAVTPSDGGAGGTFTPASVPLSTACPSATFTYTPTGTGSRTIRTTNDGNLTDPAPLAYTILPAATSFSLTGPGEGDCSVASPYMVALPPGTGLAVPVSLTLAASDGDGTFQPAGVVLSNTSRSATFTYTPSSIGARTLSASSHGALIDPAPLPFRARAQLGSTVQVPPCVGAPDHGGCDLLAAGYLREFARDITADAVDPRSDAWMATAGPAIHLNFSQTIGYPINVVPGTQPCVPVTALAYPDVFDAPSAPIPDHGLALEAPYRDGSPPKLEYEQAGSDQHVFVLQRDEATGGLVDLFEYQNAWSVDDGRSWNCHGGAHFDLRTGQVRPDGWTSSDAAGNPIWPLVVRYDEVARGDVKHALRCTWNPAQVSRLNYAWPSRHLAGQSNNGIPLGARLRLKQSWYDANKDRFTGQARVILDAFREHGIIMSDNAGPLFIDGTADNRWDFGTTSSNVFGLQGVTRDALEVVRIREQIQISGPSTGPVGVPQAFTFRYAIADDFDFAGALYLCWRFGSDTSWNLWGPWGPTGTVSLDPANATATATFTPTQAGAYSLWFAPNDGQGWYIQGPTTFQATADTAARCFSLSGPDEGLLGQPTAPYTVALPAGVVLDPPVTITPSDGGLGGSFSPPSVQLSTARPSATFTYSPASAGVKAIAASSGGALTDPLDRPIFIREGLRPAEAVWIWGARLIPVGTTSNFWVRIPPGTTLSGPATVTPSDNGAGGRFQPPSVELTTAAPMAVFAYTAPATPVSARITLAVTPQGIPATRWDVTIAAEATTYSVSFDGAPVLPAGKAGDSIRVALPDCGAYLANPTPNTITFSDGGAGGTFYPASVSLSTVVKPACFSYAPPADAVGRTIRLSARGTKAGVIDPPDLVGQVLAAATTYTVTGPSSACRGVPAQYTVAVPPDTALGVPVVVSISDGGAGGLIEPPEVLLINQQPIATFTYTMKIAGTVTLSFTNTTSALPDTCVVLSDPPPFPVACALPGPATTFLLTPPDPASGPSRCPSGAFTVSLPAGATLPSPVLVIPSDGSDGTFAPGCVTLSNSQAGATFTYTPRSGGVKTISCDNDGGLRPPASVLYSVATVSPRPGPPRYLLSRRRQRRR
jgi:hypothetical protein